MGSKETFGHCPALLVAAPASGQGKSTLAAALACHHRNLGRRVRAFKTGPDFLDAMVLERASGNPVYQLDLWMTGENDCRRLLHSASREADIIIVEGVMGLFDGNPSTADLAMQFGIPVLLLIGAGAMAQTFGAIAHGLSTFRPGMPIAGVAANFVASEAHGEMLREALPENLPWLGAVGKTQDFGLPGRHLGLVQAEEIADLERRIGAAAIAIGGLPLAELPAIVSFPPAADERPNRSLNGVRIGIARDLAFGFIYQANLDVLRQLGAKLTFFSPLEDDDIGQIDALYLPGGYPELHLDRLAANQRTANAIRSHHAGGNPIYAECGGMLYLLESLTTKDGVTRDLVGLLPGHARMQGKLAALGFQSAKFPEGELRGHTFHHSIMETAVAPTMRGNPQRPGRPGEAIYRIGSLTASYLHLYFSSCPASTSKLFIRSTSA